MKKELQRKNLLLLIDFIGHPVLGCEHTNNLRYSYLQALLFNDLFDLVVVSDHKPWHEKECELERIVKVEGRLPWINIDCDAEPTVPDIVDLVKEQGIDIEHVIIGGTNTSGCCFRTRSYSANKWHKYGYTVKFFLPLCAEYQSHGINEAERNMHAYAIIAKDIKKHQLHNIDIVSNFNELKPPRRLGKYKETF